VLEVAGISSPERIPGRLYDGCAGFLCVFHDGVDLLPASHIMPDGEFGRAAAGLCNPCIMGKLGARPQRQLESRLQVEKRYGAVLELPADDPFCREPETVPVKGERLFQI